MGRNESGIYLFSEIKVTIWNLIWNSHNKIHIQDPIKIHQKIKNQKVKFGLTYAPAALLDADFGLDADFVWLPSQSSPQDLKQYHVCNSDNSSVIPNTTLYTINFNINTTDDPPLLLMDPTMIYHPLRTCITPLPVFEVRDEDSDPSEIFYHHLGAGSG